MIISPPFLPPVNAIADDDWLDMAMLSPSSNDGQYPVAANMGWHGGIHLLAPSDGVSALPVRAIADGIVVYVRQATIINQDESDPLNYDAGQQVAGWTSDGCVIIKHETDIGTGDASRVCFFSCYIHLQTIAPPIVQGSNIYRRDKIGNAGYLYGTPNLIHFEIICDDTNVEKLIGRSSGDASLTINGRSDAVYGDIYFHLPIGTQIFSTAPALPSANVSHRPTPILAHTTTEELFVGIRQARHSFSTTYRVNGSRVENTLQEEDFEYDLYKKIKALQPVCPSAMYELFTFGRVLSNDVLAPLDAVNWRRISYPGGQGWVNLGSDIIRKFSDADFPQWRGWKLIDDSADHDCRMDSPTIHAWLDRNGDGVVTPTEARSQLSTADIQKKLANVICKIPTEWDSAMIDARWGWLKTPSPHHPDALSDSDFERLKEHIKKLCFWSEASLHMSGMSADHWHFHPREFIRHFRKCGWLSIKELAQCLPRRSLSGNLAWAAALTRATKHNLSINTLFRKYFGSNRIRYVHALSQIYIETGVLQLMEEGGSGSGHQYGAFYGRGYMQLTWPSNYSAYGAFKNIANKANSNYSDRRISGTSTHIWSDGATAQQWHPRFDPNVVGTDLLHGAESSGFFWISKSFRGTKNINRVCDLGATPTTVAFISWLVNGGGNGYDYRQQYAAYLSNFFADDVPKIGSINLRYPPLAPSGNPTLCRNFPPTEVPYTQQLTVMYDRQIP
jgi:predicted chitinase